MKKVFISSIVFFLVLSISTAFAAGKGDEIARKYYNLKKTSDSYSIATMTLTDKGGTERNRTLKMYKKNDEQTTSSFIEFDSPADVKGTRFLSISNKNGKDEQRIYLPALKKVRLIATSGKGGKFVGSDFFYYDLEDRDFEDFTYNYLRAETFGTHNCHVIEMLTKSTESPYSKAEAFIDSTDNFVYQMKLFDKKSGAPIKTMSVLQSEVFDGCIIPTKVLMNNIRDNTKTTLLLSDIKVNQGMDSKIFTVQNMEKN